MINDVFAQTGYCLKHNRIMMLNLLDNQFVCDQCMGENNEH